MKRLLFITQRINSKDDDLAFTILWIREFIRQGYSMQVICLELGEFDGEFPVYSLGRERGVGRIGRLLRYWWALIRFRYDRVFVHMNPIFVSTGLPILMARRMPTYLWYTHYSTHIHLKIAAWFCRRMFAATKQSLPQYDESDKKVVTGHGIDVDYWDECQREPEASPKKLLAVYRICRSKRLELTLRALALLGEDYSLDVYGRPLESDYYEEMMSLIDELRLNDRVTMRGPVPMEELKRIYPKYRLLVNMAPETIDKTVLEAMYVGLYPVTTAGNAEAVGLPVSPADDSPEEITAFIRGDKWREYNTDFLREIVIAHHSLGSIVAQMGEYISQGT